MNRSQHSYRLQSLYQMVGITKQAHYKRLVSKRRLADIEEKLVLAAQQLRAEHPRMGCRKMYWELQPDRIGRDRAEAMLLANGLRVKRKRNYLRTTRSGKQWYPNLIQGMKIYGIHELWVSDITTIVVSSGQYYYLTLVQDVYSRKIVGWSLSVGMRACQTVIPAYVMAIHSIPDSERTGLIFHSDKGSQYYHHELAQLHQQYGVRPSMGGKAWENAHAETINGILKGEYIDVVGLNISLPEAKKVMQSIILKYNQQRPHGSLKNMKPVEFENFVHQLADEQKPIVTINY